MRIRCWIAGIILGIIAYALIGVLGGAWTVHAPAPLEPAQPGALQPFAGAGEASRREMIARAEAVFLGEVLEVSPTLWNQDSGAEYPRGMKYHTIKVRVEQDLFDRMRLSCQAPITILGPSPVDNEAASHQLAPGDRAVFFIYAGEIPWQGGGSRLVNYIPGSPQDSILLLGDDGLYHGHADEPAYTFDELHDIIFTQKFPNATR